MKKDNELSPELFDVARKKGTEAPFSGKYWNEHADGMYACAVCGTELFSSDTKFDSGTGWPSFTDTANREHIELRPDTSHGTRPNDRSHSVGRVARTEVVCKKCGAHLGHVFNDGPQEKGGKRYCINSVCLELKKG